MMCKYFGYLDWSKVNVVGSLNDVLCQQEQGYGFLALYASQPCFITWWWVASALSEGLRQLFWVY
jgi:hypothetical protein